MLNGSAAYPLAQLPVGTLLAKLELDWNEQDCARGQGPSCEHVAHLPVQAAVAADEARPHVP